MVSFFTTIVMKKVQMSLIVAVKYCYVRTNSLTSLSLSLDRPIFKHCEFNGFSKNFPNMCEQGAESTVATI